MKTRTPERFQLFDPLSAAEYEALKADIAERGVLVPVELDDQGVILDGHHRDRACRQLGIECPTIVRPAMTEDEKRSHVIALNIHRRHLRPDEHARYIAELRAAGMSQRAIARQTGTSQPTVSRRLSGDSGESPERVEGLDGKSYPAARSVPSPPAPLVDGEAEAIVDNLRQANGTEPTDDELADALDECLESKATPVWTPTKPDVGGGVSHPARYSDALLAVFAEVLDGYRRVLDPFAGTGRIHELEDHETVGVELEEEWASLHPQTVVGSALALDFPDNSFDAVCTSPTYGNRLADHHDAIDPERRRSYTHDLGRHLSADNSGAMQWGDDYRSFHDRAWAEAARVLRPGGRFVLNIKDHVRDGRRQAVTGWHVGELQHRGLVVVDIVAVVPRHLAAGANATARADAEFVIVMDKP